MVMLLSKERVARQEASPGFHGFKLLACELAMDIGNHPCGAIVSVSITNCFIERDCSFKYVLLCRQLRKHRARIVMPLQMPSLLLPPVSPLHSA